MKRKKSFFLGFLSGSLFTGVAMIGSRFIMEQKERHDNHHEVRELLPIPRHDSHDSYDEDFPIEDWFPTSKEETASQMVEMPVQHTVIPQKETVYWTEQGKTYHIDPSCSSLLRSKSVLSGSLAEATEEVPRKPCHLCSQGE